MPNKRQESNWFLETHEFLSNNGYAAYEVSNFSKPGYECIHNLHYWNIEPYLAFGPSAHGYDGQSRWNNARSLDLYIDKVLAGESAISMEEKVSLTNRLNEKIGFGIRMTKGIDIKDIPNKYQNLFKRNIKDLKQKYPSCIDTKDTSIFLTAKGMLFADEIIPDMLL
jgi:oxygen-independent coproporphyrinogen-3 oxidase